MLAPSTKMATRSWPCTNIDGVATIPVVAGFTEATGAAAGVTGALGATMTLVGGLGLRTGGGSCGAFARRSRGIATAYNGWCSSWTSHCSPPLTFEIES
jgi:hypothetical protein